MVLFCGQCVSLYVRCAVHKKNKVRSLAKHVLPPLQLTTEPPKTCLCDVWQSPFLQFLLSGGLKRGGTSRLVFAEACDSKFRHASELLNPFRVQVKCCMVHLFRSSCVCSLCSVCSAKEEDGLMSGETRVADAPTCN